MLSNTFTASAMPRAAENEPGILVATVMAGSSPADFRDAGISVVVVADGDPARAEAVGADLARQKVQRREPRRQTNCQK